jgi:predicted metal-dependent phosphoesterase TrpH
MIDLHIHTDASSDGVHSPREIFDMARAVGLDAIAFADHNTTANVEEGIELAGDYGISFVPAVELSSGYRDQDVHVLGYFIDQRSSALADFLSRYEEESVAQTRRRVELLMAAGFVLDAADVMAASGGRQPTGRSFLQALVAREENKDDERLARYATGDRSASPSQFFYQDFLAGGRPAYVPLTVSTTEVAIRQIQGAGGIPILAHPGVYPPSVVDEVIDLGAQGLEVYSGYHDAAATALFIRLCLDRGLLMSAGSDFHGKEVKPDIRLGVRVDSSYDIYTDLREAYRKKHAQANP